MIDQRQAENEAYAQSDENKKRAEIYVKKQGVLETERTNTENTWQECYKYTVPRKGDVTTMLSPGDKRGSELFDTTAIHANELLSAALHGNLTNPAIQFLELVMGDPDLDEDEDVRGWLQDTADKMFLVMNNSNFQTEIHEIYIDLGAIGTACLFTGSHKENIVHFSARAMKEIYIDEDNTGRIDTVHRKFKWKLRQIVLEFGEKALSDKFLKMYRDGNEDSFEIIHAVHPMSDEEYKANPKKHAFKSCYVLKDDLRFLSEDGFRKFPYAVPRWTKTSGEKYGRGCGQSMLPDVKMINAMEETNLQSGQLATAPPLGVYNDSIIGRPKLTPFGITIVKRNFGDQFPIQPLITGARVDFGFQATEALRQRIRAGWYVNQFQTIPNDGKQRTAEEVVRMTDENFRLMGPVLGRQHFELLDPTVVSVYDHMEADGKIPEMPDKLKLALKAGKKIQVRFSSPIARAQRISEAENLNRALVAASPLINAIPETMDIIDGDASLKHIFDTYGVTHKIFRKNNDVQERRQARSDAQAKLAQEQSQQHQADIASKVGPAAASFAQANQQMQGNA